jgi:hypothetical protein
VENIFKQLMLPKLRSFISEVYRDISYSLDENGYQSSGYQDLVRKRFVRNWDQFIEVYKVRPAMQVSWIRMMHFLGYIHGSKLQTVL